MIGIQFQCMCYVVAKNCKAFSWRGLEGAGGGFDGRARWDYLASGDG